MKKFLLSGFLTAMIFSIYAQTQVGRTNYDLQTNNSTGRRIAVDPSGNDIVITYTKSYMTAPGYEDRGTGYNYSSDGGTNWDETTFTGTFNGAGSFNEVDIDRNGWPDVAYTNSKEIIVSHFAEGTHNGLQVLSREIGSGSAFTKTELNSVTASNSDNSTEADATTWARIATHGDSVFIISALSDGTDLPGMTGGLLMYRSIDAGVTWEGPDNIPLVNSANFVTNSGDSYAIDISANGKVAIVLGSFQVEVITSTDWGATFTKQTVVATRDINGVANPLYSGLSGETLDTMDLSDRSYSLVVDDNDKVHVWFGRTRYLKDESTTSGTSSYPLEVGLMYWNDAMDEAKIIHESRFATQQVETLSPYFSPAVISATTGLGAQTELYFASLTSMSSAGFDDAGNIFVAYAGMKPLTFDNPTELTGINNTDDNNLHYSDIYLLKSSDNGATWVGPINVTNEPLKECVYPGVPRKVYGTEIPLIWQQDSIPGINLQVPAGLLHPTVENEIMFNSVPMADILTPTDITVPTISENVENQNTVTAYNGCLNDIDFSTRFNNDDVPTGTDVLNYIMIDTATNAAPVLVSGTNNIHIYVLDANGNSSDTLPAIVEVLVDAIDPTVTLIGPDTLDVVVNTTYADPGIDYSDNACYPTLPAVPGDDVNINISAEGTYEFTWSVEDNSGNTTVVVRYVNVITSDSEAPEFTDLGSQYNTIEACTESWTDPGVTAFDNVDFDVTGSVTSEITYNGATVSSVDETVPGEYIITYTVEDAATNEGTYIRTVFVDDTQAPVITLSTTDPVVYVCLGGAFTAPTPSSPANCLNPPTITDDGDVSVNVNLAGNYTVEYTAVDDSLNTSTKTILVKVGQAPVSNFEYTVVGNNVSTVDLSTVGNPTNWDWDWDDNSKPSTAHSYTPTGSHSYSSPGLRTICLTVTNQYTEACNTPATEQKSCQEVDVEVGIAEVEKLNSSVNIYPNPSNGLVNVSVSQENLMNVQVSIINVIGDVIAAQTIENTSKNSLASFNLGENASGVYIVNIKTEKANTSKKVIIK